MEEEKNNQKVMIVGALVLAVIFAAALWYGFTNQSDLGPSDKETQQVPEADVLINKNEDTSAFNDFIATDNTSTPKVLGEQAPVNVPTTSETGTTEWLLATAFVSMLVGAFGIKKQLKKF